MDDRTAEEKYFFINKAGARIKNLIGVVAGKGGVGKSTVTVNLAIALQKMGWRVGILDADLYGPSLQKMLPEDNCVQKKNEDALFPAEKDGIKMISMAYFRQDDAMVVRAPIANAYITQFLDNVDWGSLDYLLIDFPPGTGDIHLTLMQEGVLSGAVVVTTPQEVALIDVRKALQMLDQMQVPVLGIIENMSFWRTLEGEVTYPFSGGAGTKLSEERGIPLIGKIPLDPVLSSYMDLGKSIFDPPCSVSGEFMHIARDMERNLEAMQASFGLRSFELIWKEME